MTLAHVASVPLEELLLLAPAASALWLAIRAGAHAGPRPSPTRDRQRLSRCSPK
jgi:hypothetical protein